MFQFFWDRYPPLHIALCFLLGVSLSLCFSWILIACLITLFVTSPRKYLFQITFVTLGFLHSYHPPLCFEEKEGTAYFQVQRIKKHQGPFQTYYCYEGIIRSFHSENEKYRNLSCQIYLPHRVHRPKANCDYILKGKLIQKRPRHFLFKVQKKIKWIPVEKSFSLSETRFVFKKKVKSYLSKQIQHRPSFYFLSTLATGDLENRILAFEFNRLGLSHILAISGFHFALLTLFIGVILRRFFSLKLVAIALLIFINLYFIYIGSSPSITRAYLGLSFFLISYLCNRRSLSLNMFGATLLGALILDPLSLTSLGFQLSFLATFGILSFTSLFEKKLRILLPPRPYCALIKMRALHQWGYIFSATIRQTLALNLAIQFTTLPLILFAFHKFPLFSLVYNLFFPLGIAISLFLLLLGFLFIPLPFLSHCFHILNENYTAYLLNLVAYPPIEFEYFIYAHSFPSSLLIIYVVLLLGIKIHSQKKSDQGLLIAYL